MGMLMGQCVLFQQVTGIIAHCDWHRSALLDDVIDDGFTLWDILFNNKKLFHKAMGCTWGPIFYPLPPKKTHPWPTEKILY